MKIKLEQDGNGEWNWNLGGVSWDARIDETFVTYRRVDATKYPSRETALEAAKKYAKLFQHADRAKQVVKSEELEL